MSASPLDFLLATDAPGRRLERATVAVLYQNGSVGVRVAGAEGDELRCDVLVAAGAASAAGPVLVPGQPVLVWHPGRPHERGVVLGVVGAARALTPLPAPDEPAHPPLAATLPAPRPAAEQDALPESLVIEARDALTLRVGEGSITLRADGRILIQGRDLVSSARRLNRIKGGAVSIN